MRSIRHKNVVLFFGTAREQYCRHEESRLEYIPCQQPLCSVFPLPRSLNGLFVFLPLLLATPLQPCFSSASQTILAFSTLACPSSSTYWFLSLVLNTFSLLLHFSSAPETGAGVTEQGTPFLCTEYMELGALKTILHVRPSKHRSFAGHHPSPQSAVVTRNH